LRHWDDPQSRPNRETPPGRKEQRTADCRLPAAKVFLKVKIKRAALTLGTVLHFLGMATFEASLRTMFTTTVVRSSVEVWDTTRCVRCVW
jgi:hypothetical protein